MIFQTYYLKFTTPLHLGDYKPDSYEKSESFLHSDTIMAAIFSAWAKSGHADWIINDGNPHFTISSAFPYYEKGGKKILFFPRIKKPLQIENPDNDIAKLLKKTKWLDQEYFEAIIHNRKLEEIKNHIQGEYISKHELPKDGLIQKQVSERVRIPRDMSESESEPFYMERIYFNDSGLFFLATGTELEKLEKALDFLSREGVGTDRNIGNGFFEWDSGTCDLDIPDSDYATNLGLYCPENKEQIETQVDSKSSYDLIKRGGWITTEGMQGIEKNSVYMFTEGSVFHTPQTINGNPNIDLTPDILEGKIDHKIYRFGRSIFIPVKI